MGSLMSSEPAYRITIFGTSKSGKSTLLQKLNRNVEQFFMMGYL